jgi:hypothetical protein
VQRLRLLTPGFLSSRLSELFKIRIFLVWFVESLYEYFPWFLKAVEKGCQAKLSAKIVEQSWRADIFKPNRSN